MKQIPKVITWKIRLGTGEIRLVDTPTKLLAKLNYRQQYGYEFYPLVSITPLKRG